MIRYNDQRGDDDGVTVEDTLLPNVIGWGETPEEAMTDLYERTTAIMQTVADLSAIDIFEGN